MRPTRRSWTALRARHDEPLTGLVERFVCGLTFMDRAALIDAMGCASARLVDQAFVDPAPDGILTTMLCRVLFEVICFGYFDLYFPTAREHPQYPDRPWVLAFPRGARHIVPFGPVPDSG